MAVFRIAFASETLFRTVNLNVIVPVETYGRTDVKKPEKFKTLYLLHGFGGSQDDWMDYSNLRASIILRLFFLPGKTVFMKI